MVITRIGPGSCARIAGTLYAVVGLLIGAVVSCIALIGGFAADRSGAAGMGAVAGVGAIIVLPILYGVLGWITAFVGAWLYNILASSVGGIELDVN
jgi:hypothetical protein